MLLRVLEILFVVLVVLAAITQIVIPVVRGQKLFPLFRKQGHLEVELANAVQKAEEKKVQDQINELKKGKK